MSSQMISRGLRLLAGLMCCSVLSGCKPEVLARFDPAQQPECFEVVNPGPNALYHLVKINKCTGESWMLVKTMVQEADPSKGKKELFTWRWAPLQTGYSEAELYRD